MATSQAGNHRYSDDELCGLIYTILLEQNRPLSAEELCLKQTGLDKHLERVKHLLDNMCSNGIGLIKVEQKFVLQENWKPDIARPLHIDELSVDGPPSDTLNRSPSTVAPPTVQASSINRAVVAQPTVQASSTNRAVVPMRQKQLQVSVNYGCDPEEAQRNTDILSKIMHTLSRHKEPLKGKDVAQRAGVGKARSDVNRYLYLLKERNVVKVDDKHQWSISSLASEEDLVVYGAELAKKPARKPKENSTSAGADTSCPCPNRGLNCNHNTFIQQNHYHYNTQVGDGGQMHLHMPHDARNKD